MSRSYVTKTVEVEVDIDDLLEALEDEDASNILDRLDEDDVAAWVMRHPEIFAEADEERLTDFVSNPYLRGCIEIVEALQHKAECPYILVLVSDEVRTVMMADRQVGVIVRKHDTDTATVYLGQAMSEFQSMDDALLFVDAKARAMAAQAKEKGNE